MTFNLKVEYLIKTVLFYHFSTKDLRYLLSDDEVRPYWNWLQQKTDVQYKEQNVINE